MKCSGSRKDGSPCRWSAFAAGLCVNCGSTAGIAEALAEQRARTSRGAAKTNAAPTKARRAPLRTVGDCLSALERALHDVELSGGDKVAKARAVAGLVSEARATLKAAELETENRELRALIVERLPELKKHLKAVP